MTHPLVGRSHTFDDGKRMEIIQIKEVDELRGGASVTYLAYHGPGIPQKLILNLEQFIDIYGQLFE
jgi:hypothetical protein